ncbi:MAG: hypothetical protein M3083_03035 [Actinomycetota bacterium]|nr:hypothetical protein [Actinomycetota bacterium]
MITTFAGGGVGDGGPATKAVLGPAAFGFVGAYGVAVDRSGDVFVATNRNVFVPFDSSLIGFDRVRRIDAVSGAITTAAGMGTQGFSGDGGPATAAQVANPQDVGFDGSGNMYVLDGSNQRVRRVAAGTGVITTVAGGADQTIPGVSGDGGPATKATLALTQQNVVTGLFYGGGPGLAVDSSGDLFIGDVGNNRVRRVDHSTGTISTVAGGGSPSDGLGDGGQATSAAVSPGDVGVDGAGNLYISDRGRVRRVDHATGVITTYAGGGSPLDGFGDGGLATSASVQPGCVDFDNAGNLVICDRGRVRRVDHSTGIITTIAGGSSPPDGLGDDGPATSAAISLVDVAFDAVGDLYVTDLNGARVRKVDHATAIISTVAGGPNDGAGSGDGGPAMAAFLKGPAGVATIGSETYISDGCDGYIGCDNQVRKVDASGIITTFAGGGRPPDGFGDGGPATSAAVSPGPLAGDAAGDLFIADRGRVRKVDGHTGIISTVAGGGSPADGVGDGGPATSAALTGPNGLFVVGTGNARWPAGTLFIADGTRVRAVNLSGIITTVAGNGTGTFGGDGGPAVKAGFGFIQVGPTQYLGARDVVVDPVGDVYISDQGSSRVRRVDAGTGIITTVAGDGGYGLAGIGAPATGAHVNTPTGLVFGHDGSLFIFDGYARVVKVDPHGVLRLVAGTGAPGLGGDGGPAVDAETSTGGGQLALDGSGDLFFTDRNDLRVREVRPGVADPPAGCGEVITAPTTLTADLGPCPRSGIIVGADHVTLNLNGHRVFGSGTAQNGQYAGIMISGHTGVTVTGGQVDHFSAAVVIVNSTDTTVKT